MKRTILGLAMALTLALVCPAAQAQTAPQGPGGKIVNTNGQTIVVEQFTDLVDTLPYIYEESEQTAPMRDVLSLTLAPDNTVLLRTTDGKTVRVILDISAVSLDQSIHYQTRDAVTGEMHAADIDGVFVRKIKFDWK